MMELPNLPFMTNLSPPGRESVSPLPQTTADLKEFTAEELREFDGSGDDGTVLVALMGNVYDVTAGSHFYGPGGPYNVFAGRDATRGLATFNMRRTDEVCDINELSPRHQENAKRWETLFKQKYPLVGTLEVTQFTNKVVNGDSTDRTTRNKERYHTSSSSTSGGSSDRCSPKTSFCCVL